MSDAVIPIENLSKRAVCMCGSHFAVAAHFEPEALIVDGVLAAGNAQLQKKASQDVIAHGVVFAGFG